MYDLNCHRCGSPFACAAQNGRYCKPCRTTVNREFERASRRRNRPPLFNVPEMAGGIVRLSDIPPAVRFAAFRELVDTGQLCEDEIPVAFAAALEPGHLSTRVA